MSFGETVKEFGPSLGWTKYSYSVYGWVAPRAMDEDETDSKKKFTKYVKNEEQVQLNKVNWETKNRERKNNGIFNNWMQKMQINEEETQRNGSETMDPWRTTKEKVATENGYTIVTNFPNEGEIARDTILGK